MADSTVLERDTAKRSAQDGPLGDGLLVNRQFLPFTMDKGIAHRAAIGVIVLATDQTIEHEYRKIF
jgi:maleate isomerase